MKYFGKMLGILVFGSFICFLLMVMVWAFIPDHILESHVKESEIIFDKEGRLWEDSFTHAWSAALDNATDEIMILNTVSEAEDKRTVIYKAMDCNDYARYWHGYLVFLRPLMIFCSYTEIRYIYMFIHLVLFSVILLKYNERFGFSIAFGWILSVVAINGVVLPFSLQFSSVFFIMDAALIVLDCSLENSLWKEYDIFFMIVGMLTSFFDFLTAPLITLGMPLLYLLLTQIKREKSGKEKWKTVITSSIAWGAGYLGNWAMKWVYASIVLGRNIFLDAIYRIETRTTGFAENILIGPVKALAYNLFAIVPSGIHPETEIYKIKWLVLILLIILLVVMCIFVKRHRSKEEIVKYSPVFLVSLYPYIWYIFVADHSKVHIFFTYRVQMITVMGIWILLVHCIEWRRKKDSPPYCRKEDDVVKYLEG